MAYFTQSGSALTDAEAAALQWAGHVVCDATGAPATVVISGVSVDVAGDTEITLSEDAPGVEQ